MHEQDERVVHRVLQGERRAYAQLVQKYQDKAMTLAVRMLKNREDAEEAVQDAFVRAYRALEKFEWKSNFSTWLYRIVYNVCATALERKHPRRSISLEEEKWNDYEPVDEAPLPDVEYESEEFRSVVEEEIEKLPEPYGGTFALFVVQDLSYEEIATVTGLPMGTIKARLFRARTILRASLSKRLGSQLDGSGGDTGESERKEVSV